MVATRLVEQCFERESQDAGILPVNLSKFVSK